VTRRATQSALLVASAAAAAAAVTWIGRRRLSIVDSSDEDVVDPESAELPVGRSADPEIDDSLSRTQLPQDETSGGTLRGDYEPPGEVLPEPPASDAALEEIWNSEPGFAEGEQTEGYDAVTPEDLGAVWLERATQTTHEERPHVGEPSDLAELEDLLVSESTLVSAHLEEDEDEEAVDEEDIEEEDEEVEIDDDEQ
jgi:hypothetical protein